jgi:hypothetical protein
MSFNAETGNCLSGAVFSAIAVEPLDTVEFSNWLGSVQRVNHPLELVFNGKPVLTELYPRKIK